MINIKEVLTKKEQKKFVQFPFKLYKNNSFWVPPIIKEELNFFDKNKNPVFAHADAQLFLAYKNNKIVGRIAAIINWVEVTEQKTPKMRFGWLDMIDDLRVTELLIHRVKKIGLQNKLSFIEGPVGFSNLDNVGILTEGFEHIGTMATWYNFPYYQTHLEQLGFVKEKKLLEHKFLFKNVKSAFFERTAKLIEERYQIKTLNFTKTSQILPYANEMFQLFNNTYNSLSSFVPISDNQIAYFKKKYISFINPEYIKFIIDKNHKLVAFAIVMPSFSKALQKAKGKLFPFGFYHLMQAKKHSKDVVFYLIGVHPKYQKKGATALLFKAFYNTFTKKGIVTCFRSPELAENINIRNIWKNFKPVNHKKRNTYTIDL